MFRHPKSLTKIQRDQISKGMESQKTMDQISMIQELKLNILTNTEVTDQCRAEVLGFSKSL